MKNSKALQTIWNLFVVQRLNQVVRIPKRALLHSHCIVRRSPRTFSARDTEETAGTPKLRQQGQALVLTLMSSACSSLQLKRDQMQAMAAELGFFCTPATSYLKDLAGTIASWPAHKQGGLDGWEVSLFKRLPAPLLQWLCDMYNCMEVRDLPWPEPLLEGHLVMMPKGKSAAV